MHTVQKLQGLFEKVFYEMYKSLISDNLEIKFEGIHKVYIKIQEVLNYKIMQYLYIKNQTEATG